MHISPIGTLGVLMTLALRGSRLPLIPCWSSPGSATRIHEGIRNAAPQAAPRTPPALSHPRVRDHPGGMGGGAPNVSAGAGAGDSAGWLPSSVRTAAVTAAI